MCDCWMCSQTQEEFDEGITQWEYDQYCEGNENPLSMEDWLKSLSTPENLQEDEKMNPLEEINKIAHKLPLEVLADINQRIGDWLAGGGKEDDPYIEQQLRFAKQFVD
ncbi:DUF6877 family protein [Cytobacillus firmus]|uniref:DUF6877 family protein n=1 Tax=Cytobacillus firmus TaxID=1399 RepID=UPI0018CD88E8|nr:DUF6877 family protein [Cytobacillus firmus]MBG9603935.1 hypothetical protein [Cytobacillus firmus]MBG9656086.1 hypothetical protein [Cytobacillus firmus]MED1907838.1 hypothetical protein [Cytobacillus firmus]